MDLKELEGLYGSYMDIYDESIGEELNEALMR